MKGNWELTVECFSTGDSRAVIAAITQDDGEPGGIQGSLERIAQINRDIHSQRIEFEEMEGGWRPAA